MAFLLVEVSGAGPSPDRIKVAVKQCRRQTLASALRFANIVLRRA